MQHRTRGGTLLPVAHRAAFGSYGFRRPAGDGVGTTQQDGRCEETVTSGAEAGAPDARRNAGTQTRTERTEQMAAGNAAGAGADGNAQAHAQPCGERRHPPDRRCGLDRRDSGWHTPLQAEPRAYGFRDFRSRRAMQDRRLYVEECGTWNSFARRQRDATANPGEGFVTLTPEEIEMLLAETDE
jgi:hypothetical protein